MGGTHRRALDPHPWRARTVMTCTTADSQQPLQQYKHHPWCDRHQHALAAADAGGYWPHRLGRIVQISSEVVGYWQTDGDAGYRPRFHVDLARPAQGVGDGASAGLLDTGRPPQAAAGVC